MMNVNKTPLTNYTLTYQVSQLEERIYTKWVQIRASGYIVDPEVNQVKLIPPALATIINQHITARAAHAVLIPISFVAATFDTAIGIIFGAIGCFTLGNKTICGIAAAFSRESRFILANPYSNLLKTLNPSAKTSSPPIEPISNFSFRCWSKASIWHNNMDTGFIKREFGSRALILAAGVYDIGGTILIGIGTTPWTIASLASFGTYEHVNQLGKKPFEITGLISQVIHCAVSFVNPSYWVNPGYEVSVQGSQISLLKRNQFDPLS